MRPITLTKNIYRDLRGKQTTPRSDEEHLSAAIDWLYRSQDVTECGGSAAYYSLLTGWSGPYPETSGYIVPTLYDYAEYADAREARTRAERMASWLLEVQLENGAFPGGVDPGPNADPSVFNTGQILFGLVRAYEETDEERYRSAAIEAADWLVSVQHQNGYWDRYDYRDESHSYCSRVAWALLEVGRISDRTYEPAARNHLNWVVSRQTENGWFRNAGFSEGETPYLHTLAYTIRGLLESGFVLDDSTYISSARLAADQLREIRLKDGPLKGKYDSDWNSKAFYCLPGSIQTALVWLRIHSNIAENEEYIDRARDEIQNIKTYQRINCMSIDGGIKGSHPVWDEYMRFRYPNWAAKFFIDALLLISENE
ncbi:prenyltransferase/squalene oxidase repeat-containing protein [Halorubrum rubrum]|uniref:Prenyltransferase/squalene oxidase repeat-containing protein n=1 Tax=Halorubrum rubrum TaxID=1126240 RepID=A0ABD5R433_9EURY|nr:prenyltransferase/squalene oxidase repeat-containing protein [Halorubrum rubrum]